MFSLWVNPLGIILATLAMDWIIKFWAGSYLGISIPWTAKGWSEILKMESLTKVVERSQRGFFNVNLSKPKCLVQCTIFLVFYNTNSKSKCNATCNIIRHNASVLI